MNYINYGITKKMKQATNHTVKCKCGHSLSISPLRDKKICSWCKHMVYRTKQIEFREKMKKLL